MIEVEHTGRAFRLRRSAAHGQGSEMTPHDRLFIITLLVRPPVFPVHANAAALFRRLSRANGSRKGLAALLFSRHCSKCWVSFSMRILTPS